MAYVDPAGGAGRADLINSLERLRRQYAGMPQERAVASEPPAVTRPVGTLGLPNLGAFSATVGPVAPVPGRSSGPYDLAGDGGAWGPNGVNLFNPLHARGDMPAPGPVGRGPGFWILDDFGTPYWRQDWVAAPSGDPRGYLIKGEN